MRSSSFDNKKKNLLGASISLIEAKKDKMKDKSKFKSKSNKRKPQMSRKRKPQMTRFLKEVELEKDIMVNTIMSEAKFGEHIEERQTIQQQQLFKQVEATKVCQYPPVRLSFILYDKLNRNIKKHIGGRLNLRINVIYH